MTEPRTKAGREFAQRLDWSGQLDAEWMSWILAIEDEAGDIDVDRLQRALEADWFRDYDDSSVRPDFRAQAERIGAEYERAPRARDLIND